MAPFRGKLIESFHIENVSYLTHEFVNENFDKKAFLNFLVKLLCKKSCVKFNAFSKRNSLFIFLLKWEEKLVIYLHL